VYKCNVASIGFIIMCLVRGFAIPPSSDNIEEEESVFTTQNVGFLILSSTLGIIIGDVLWLEALRLLGAKHVIVIDSLKPFMAAVLGRVALDEVLRPLAYLGMVLTVFGIGVVSWEEQRSSSAKQQKDDIDTNGNENPIEQTEATDRIGFDNEEEVARTNIDNIEEHMNSDSNQQLSIEDTAENTNTSGKQIIHFSRETSVYRRGYICAIINVLADSFGSLLTKQYGVGMTTWSINLIRFGFAGVVLICISISMRIHDRYSASPSIESGSMESQNVEDNYDTTMNRENDTSSMYINKLSSPPPKWYKLPKLSRIGWLQITAGVGLVTFLCPALSNFALFQIALGLAISLGSIGPLYGLLLDWPFKGKRPTLCGCIGVVLAIAGVVILCVWGV